MISYWCLCSGLLRPVDQFALVRHIILVPNLYLSPELTAWFTHYSRVRQPGFSLHFQPLPLLPLCLGFWVLDFSKSLKNKYFPKTPLVYCCMEIGFRGWGLVLFTKPDLVLWGAWMTTDHLARVCSRKQCGMIWPETRSYREQEDP